MANNLHPKSRYKVVVIDGEEYVFRGGTADIGTKRYGAIGGSPHSLPQVLAAPVIEDLARSMSITEDKAREFLYELGRVCQRRLLRGLPCGLPFVGAMCVSQKRYTVEQTEKIRAGQRSRLAKLKAQKAQGYAGWKTATVDALIAGAETTIETWVPFRNKVMLLQPRHLRNFYSDNVPYLGHAKDHARPLFEDQCRNDKRRRGTTAPLHIRRRIRLAQEGAPPLHIPQEQRHEHLISAPSRRRYAVA
jgi:hypothetical protein